MRLIVSILTALGLSLLAVTPLSAEGSEASQNRNLPSVTVSPARIAEVQARIPVSGTLVARQAVQIFPQVSGHEITELLVETGDKVEKGQVLARLSTDTLAARMAQADAEYQRAEASVGQARSNIDSSEALLTQAGSALERALQLKQGGNVAQAALDQAIATEANARAQAASAADGLAVAQAALAQAEAARQIARLDLDRTEITAPVAGLVVTRNAELGALAGGSAEPMFAMIADGDIEVSAEVIETALQRLSVGDVADMTIAGLGNVGGEVRLVPASVDPTTRLGLMRIALDDHDGLRIGLFASGWIVTDRRETVTVPASAVLSDASGDRVQVVIDGKVDSREVRTGVLWQGRREILEGVAAGENVITRAGAFFRTGDAVRAVEPVTQPMPAAGDDISASVAVPTGQARQR
jgi:HlyD family secretion protein